MAETRVVIGLITDVPGGETRLAVKGRPVLTSVPPIVTSYYWRY